MLVGLLARPPQEHPRTNWGECWRVGANDDGVAKTRRRIPLSLDYEGVGAATDQLGAREGLIRRFLAFTNEFPWQWSASHVDEWTLTAEHHMAPATSSHRICQVSVVI